MFLPDISNLDYYPDTGLFKWNDHYFSNLVGAEAGRLNSNGYRQICIKGIRYYEHRLAFVCMLGRWPIEDADHKDRVRNNNKWENLREATRQQNNFNTSLNITNKLGVKGVSIVVKSGKYKAQIRINGIVTILGICNTEEEAAKLYDVKSKKLHGEFYFNPN